MVFKGTIWERGHIKIVNDEIWNVVKRELLLWSSRLHYDKGRQWDRDQYQTRNARKSHVTRQTLWYYGNPKTWVYAWNLTKARIWSVALYGFESLTLRKKEERMIKAFELWLCRSVLRVSWREKDTNEHTQLNNKDTAFNHQYKRDS